MGFLNGFSSFSLFLVVKNECRPTMFWETGRATATSNGLHCPFNVQQMHRWSIMIIALGCKIFPQIYHYRCFISFSQNVHIMASVATTKTLCLHIVTQGKCAWTEQGGGGGIPGVLKLGIWFNYNVMRNIMNNMKNCTYHNNYAGRRNYFHCFVLPSDFFLAPFADKH